MRLLNAIAGGLRELTQHRLRSFVATLAIILGVGSLMATLALTAGMAANERRLMITWGGVERLAVRDRTPPASQQEKADNSAGKTYADILAIQRNATLIRKAAPDDFVVPFLTVTYGSKSIRPVCPPLSANEDTAAIWILPTSYGRSICPLDILEKNRICVIGKDICEQMGVKPEEAVGKNLKLNGTPFRIVGVTSPSIEPRKNKFVLLPKTTAQSMFRNQPPDTVEAVSKLAENKNTRVDEIALTALDMDCFEEAIDQVRNILTFTHRGIEDFAFDTQEDWFEQIEGRVRASRLTGLLTALVSLAVGGAGVANVMLASIRQRIHEIGIRRAVGARQLDIFVQIISETIAMSIIGGLLGLGAGWGLLRIFASYVQDGAAPLLEWPMIWISFSSALVVGVGSGLYPAWRGATLNPTEALHAE